MKILVNPVVLRMVLVFLAGAFSFVIGVVIIRRIRANFASNTIDSMEPASLDTLPLHTYHAVIQQLKQQKHELQSSQQADRRRARTSENISSAVLSHLSSGVMFIDSNGLVRQANTAARRILGFASPVGMGLQEVFREATLTKSSQDVSLAEVVRNALRDKSSLQQLQVSYRTPTSENRTLEVTMTLVESASGDFLGAACLINDQTEIVRVRQQQAMRGEISAEMALELRNSLATISDCAKRLCSEHDGQSIQQLATDIASEAAHLDHTIGGFLSEPKAARAAAGV